MSGGFCAEPEELALADGRRMETVRLKDETAGVSVVVAPAAGGEIASLGVRWRGRWVESLYRALDYGPVAGWPGRAPLLFPQVGRCYAPSARPPSPIPEETPCSWELDGQVLPMPGHGFARNTAWELDGYGEEESCAWARCVLRSGETTRRTYPFDFRLVVTHCLREGRAISRYELTAGENGRPMPFTIGNHVSLRAPLSGEGTFDEVRVRTPCAWQQVHTADNLFNGKRRSLDLGAGRTLADARLHDIVLGGYGPDGLWAVLEDPRSFSLRVSQREVTGFFSPEKAFFVFWGERDLRYFCPEPWLGGPDGLNRREYSARLAPGETFIWEMVVEPIR